MKTLCLAGLLAITPALAFASCGKGHQAAMSCASGSAWDADQKACLPIASS